MAGKKRAVTLLSPKKVVKEFCVPIQKLRRDILLRHAAKKIAQLRHRHAGREALTDLDPARMAREECRFVFFQRSALERAGVKAAVPCREESFFLFLHALALHGEVQEAGGMRG
jgi:hypothetical protein